MTEVVHDLDMVFGARHLWWPTQRADTGRMPTTALATGPTPPATGTAVGQSSARFGPVTVAVRWKVIPSSVASHPWASRCSGTVANPPPPAADTMIPSGVAVFSFPFGLFTMRFQ